MYFVVIMAVRVFTESATFFSFKYLTRTPFCLPWICISCAQCYLVKNRDEKSSHKIELYMKNKVSRAHRWFC